MEFEYISRQRYWSDAARSLNSNFDKVREGLDEVVSETVYKKGAYETVEELNAAYPSAPENSWAYVGADFKIYTYGSRRGWTYSGKKGDIGSIDLQNYATSEILPGSEDWISPFIDEYEGN